MSNLTGRYAIVTGAGKGIGEAIVRRFLADGIAGVALLDYDGDLVAATAKKLDPSGDKLLAITCDVSKPDQIESAVKQVVDKFGTVDILINNAGITRDAMLHKMTPEQWKGLLDVNLDGPFYMTKAVIGIMRDKKWGRIVNISSTSAFGNPGQTNYSASKAGLIGFTKTLAKEGASKNIVVNAIAPGYIDTDMMNAVPEHVMEHFMTLIPMGRLGTTDEIASVTSFLSSEDVSFMSGQVLIVSGAANT